MNAVENPEKFNLYMRYTGLEMAGGYQVYPEVFHFVCIFQLSSTLNKRSTCHVVSILIATDLLLLNSVARFNVS